MELQLQISLSNDYSGLISFRIVWFDLLVVHGTLKSLLQDHSSKASILRSSASRDGIASQVMDVAQNTVGTAFLPFL